MDFFVLAGIILCQYGNLLSQDYEHIPLVLMASEEFLKHDCRSDLNKKHLCDFQSWMRACDRDLQLKAVKYV